ncbi:uncharacterized protein [Rutidosis leptorrhynchoides]|uniref:uncharacterized protein n=1 Tax=Rutidosis leptorrhynchoides TaxID=125765 RepID=UPI003A99DF61
MEVQLNSPPEELTKRRWRRLLEYWSRERVKAMTDKNKANRANKKLTQVTGKKSFARIREEHKTSFGREPTRVDKFKKCFTNGSADGEAATVLVMGRNNSGSAQTYGLGVRTKDLWGVVHGRSAVRKENAQFKCDKAELENENSRLKAQLARKNNGSGVENEGSGHQDNGSVVKRLTVRDEVYVKSITNNEVARRKLVSIDSTTVVLQTEFGAGWCEVELQVAIERNKVLFRPYEHIRYIHDVIGMSTAWPTALIELEMFLQLCKRKLDPNQDQKDQIAEAVPKGPKWLNQARKAQKALPGTKGLVNLNVATGPVNLNVATGPDS